MFASERWSWGGLALLGALFWSAVGVSACDADAACKKAPDCASLGRCSASEEGACIAKTKAPIAVCNEGGCTLNMAGACQRGNVDVKFISLAEIIAEGLGLMEPSA